MPNDLITAAAACEFFGGKDRPLNPSTLYRGIQQGRFPKPIHIGPNTARWMLSECEEARKRMMEERNTSSVPVRRRGPKRVLRNGTLRCNRRPKPKCWRMTVRVHPLRTPSSPRSTLEREALSPHSGRF